jgi:hypothetical protein
VSFFIGTSGDDIIFENQFVGFHRDEHLPFDVDKNFFMGSRSVVSSKYGGCQTKPYAYHGQENDSNVEASHRTFSFVSECPGFRDDLQPQGRRNWHTLLPKPAKYFLPRPSLGWVIGNLINQNEQFHVLIYYLMGNFQLKSALMKSI